MVKISTKGRYALRLMLDLTLHSGERCVSIKEISSRQGISEKYLEQIISALNRAGFLKSTRGAQGGYRLARRPQQITVGQVLRVMEGSLAPVDCVAAGAPECPRAESCVTCEIWSKIRDAVDGVVDSVTLWDLAQRQQEKVSKEE